MTSLEERQKIINSINEFIKKPLEIDTVRFHLPPKYAQRQLKPGDVARFFGIDRSTYYRWLKSPRDDQRKGRRNNLPCLSEETRQEAVAMLKKYPDLTPAVIAAKCLYEFGRYLCSTRTFYRLMGENGLNNPRRSNGGKGTQHNFNRTRLVADGPNQIWCWDITYLNSDVRGVFFFLYSILDLYSRKNIYHDVYECQSDSLAARFLENALRCEHIAIAGHLPPKECAKTDIIIQNLILHSDNGGPMKGCNMIAKMAALGIQASYSRPLHSNDNAAMESSFATLKHGHSVPIPKAFSSVKDARQWTDKFYHWYNTEHRHSGICYLTPEECHSGRAQEILAQANEIRAQINLERGLMNPLKPLALPKTVSICNFKHVTNKAIANKLREEDYRSI